MSTASRLYRPVFNVLDYGANNYAGNTDNAPAFQAAIDAAANAINTIGVTRDAGAIIEVPAGHYEIFTPIRLNNSRITMRGTGRGKTNIFPRMGGIGLYIGSSANAVNTTAGITTSGGSSLLFSPGTDLSTGRFSLRDVPGGDINGLSAFTAELYVRPTAISDNVSLLESGGTRLSGEARASAYSLSYDTSGALTGRITTTTTTYTVTAGAGTITVGATKHVALSWDGSTLRLFVAGVLLASTATTGTLVQQPWEDHTMGRSPLTWPEAGALLNAINGAVDSVRISDAGIYTAAFTPPTARLTQLSSTRVLVNMSQQIGPYTQIQSKYGTGYLLFRPLSLLSNALTNVVVEDLTIGHGSDGSIGPMALAIVNSSINRFEVTNGRQGLSMLDNCYLNIIRDYRVVIQNNATTGQGARFGFVGSSAFGVNRLDTFDMTGGAYPFFVGAGSSGHFSHIFIQTQTPTKWGFTLKNDAGGSDNYVIDNLVINNESGGAPVEYPVLVSTNPSVVFNGGTLYFFGVTPFSAAFLINGGGTTIVNGIQIVISAVVTQIIEIRTAPTNPVIANSLLLSGGTPLTLTPKWVQAFPGAQRDDFPLVKDVATGANDLFISLASLTADRTLTVQDASYILAGINLAQLFSAVQSFNQRLQGQAAAGSNQNGTTTLALAGGPGTGTGAAQLLIQKFWLKQASGTTAHVASTGDYPIGSVMHNQIADVTIANTTSELSIFTTGVSPSTTTLEAGMDRLGRRFLIRAAGEFGFTGTPTLTIRMKCGGSTIATITVTTAAGDAGRWSLDVTLTIVVAGSAGTINVDNSFFNYSNTAGGISTGRNPSAVGSLNPVDFTSSKALDVTAQWSAADPANSFQCYTALITIIP